MGKGFGELFGESLSEYGKKFVPILKAFLFLYFIPVVIFAILILIILVSTIGLTGLSVSNVSSDLVDFSLTGTTANVLYGSALFVIFLVMIIIMIILTILLTITYIHIGFAKDGGVSFSESFRVARRFFWRYLGLTIVITGFLIILDI